MKKRTKRRLQRLLADSGPLALIELVVGLLAFIAWAVTTDPSSTTRRVVLLAFFGVAGALVWLRSRLFRPTLRLFAPLAFPEPDDHVRASAREAVLSTEGAQPAFVHVTPAPDELPSLLAELASRGFVQIGGGPGEGKTTLAYHAAYRLQSEGVPGHVCRTSMATGFAWSDVEKTVLSELDLLGPRTLVIMDDAHLLPRREEIADLLRDEASEGNGRYIWIETDFDQSPAGSGSGRVRVDFGNLRPHLSDFLTRAPYPPGDPGHRAHGLHDAELQAARGHIRDAWHFNFVAARGEERLAQQLGSLDPTEVVVLFCLSALTVISGETDIPRGPFLGDLQRLPLRWLDDALRHSSFSATIDSLAQRRPPMIRIRRESPSDLGRVQPLHYNFARAVIRTLASDSGRLPDLMASLKSLLPAEHAKASYVGVLHRDLGSAAEAFDVENRAWLVQFLNDAIPDRLASYGPLLHAIQAMAPAVAPSILDEIDVASLAARISAAPAVQLSAAATLLRELGRHRESITAALDVPRLAATASAGQAAELGQVQHLIRALEDRKAEFIDALDMRPLAKTASDVLAREFSQLAPFIQVLGARRGEFVALLDAALLARAAATTTTTDLHGLRLLLECIMPWREDFADLLIAGGAHLLGPALSGPDPDSLQDLANLLKALGSKGLPLQETLDYERLAAAANGCRGDGVRGLTLFMARLHPDHRSTLITKVDWLGILTGASIHPGLLRALGGCLENLRKRADLAGDTVTTIAASGYLELHRSELLGAMKEAYRQVAQSPRRFASLYAGAGKFLWHCGAIHETLASELILGSAGDLASSFTLTAETAAPLGALLEVVEKLDPAGVAHLLSNPGPPRKISSFVASRSWTDAGVMARWLPLLGRNAPQLERALSDALVEAGAVEKTPTPKPASVRSRPDSNEEEVPEERSVDQV